MGSYAEVEPQVVTELPSWLPEVYIADQLDGRLKVLSITETVGTTPSQALLQYVASENVTGPQTILPLFQYGTRISISSGDETLFNGWLMKRNDMGSADKIVYTAVDDRIVLDRIPIRGCFVYDANTPDATYLIKLIPRYAPRVNPGGRWNCIGANVAGNLMPVFSESANIGLNYQAPFEAYPEMAADTLVPWTPRRFLMYLWLLTNMTPVGLPGATAIVHGINAAHWRSIYGSRLTWELKTIIDLNGKDPAVDNDPLDRAMPEMDFRGMRMTEAIQKTLDVAGTHTFRVKYTSNSKSEIEFVPRGYSGLIAGATKDVPVQRGGTASDINTAFDFQLDEDATFVAESVLQEGDVVRVETQIKRDNGHEDDALIPAWKDEEETAFGWIINGGTVHDEVNRYAKFPPTQGQTDFTGWLEADGEGGRPKAFARTPEAAAIARLIFPRVYKAFSIAYDKISDALDGHENAFTNQIYYPRLTCKRPPFEEQLQFLIRDLKSGQKIENTSRQNYPIYIKVGDTAETMVTVPFAVGLRVTGDGLIWFDGIAEDSDPQNYCIYSKSYVTDPVRMALKKYIYINLAFPMDHRVFGYETLAWSQSSIFTSAFNDAGVGPTLQYIDSPESYFERHQVNSSPTPHLNWYEGTATIAQPLNRFVPPGSERTHAYAAAHRKLAYLRHPRRSTTWNLIGIHTEYKAGDWIAKTSFFDSYSFEVDYEIQASLTSVTHDFQKQVTTLGGLVSEIRQ